MPDFGLPREPRNTKALSGLVVLWTFSIGLNLLSELSHVDSEILSVCTFVPQFSEQEPVGEHLASMLHEHAQKLVLLGRQLHVLLPYFDNASHEVHRQFATTKDRALAVHLQLMPQRRPHAGEQLVHAERLGDVIVAPRSSA
jgi:hypothetical protein